MCPININLQRINIKKNEILYNHWFVWVEKTNIVCHLVHLLTDISLQTNKKNGTNILCVCVCRIMYHVTTWWCMANCFFLLFVFVCVRFLNLNVQQQKTKQNNRWKIRTTTTTKKNYVINDDRHCHRHRCCCCCCRFGFFFIILNWQMTIFFSLFLSLSISKYTELLFFQFWLVFAPKKKKNIIITIFFVVKEEKFNFQKFFDKIFYLLTKCFRFEKTNERTTTT